MWHILCTSNLDLVSFLFVPALYSTMKLEIFPFTCHLTFCGQQCDSYIVEDFPLHVHIVLCCGAKTVLFTNKLSNVCVISLIPTCLQSFTHQSI